MSGTCSLLFERHQKIECALFIINYLFFYSQESDFLLEEDLYTNQILTYSSVNITLFTSSHLLDF